MAGENSVLSESERKALQEVLTSSGKSFSNPVYNPDGTVDMEASRRVEILFRLKDEEMIREMIDILNSEKMNGQTPGNVVIGPGA